MFHTICKHTRIDRLDLLTCDDQSDKINVILAREYDINTLQENKMTKVIYGHSMSDATNFGDDKQF